MIKVKRVYDRPDHTDGFRILIDRLWPRGLTKEKARVDAWIRDLAPSAELRQWFGHEEAKWPDFKKRYFRELDCKTAAITEICNCERRGTVTLLFGSREPRFNNAVALQEYLERRAAAV